MTNIGSGNNPHSSIEFGFKSLNDEEIRDIKIQGDKDKLGITDYFKNRMEKYSGLNENKPFGGMEKLKTMSLALLMAPTVTLKVLDRIHPAVPYIPLFVPLAAIAGAIYGAIHVAKQLKSNAPEQQQRNTFYIDSTDDEDPDEERGIPDIDDYDSRSSIESSEIFIPTFSPHSEPALNSLTRNFRSIADKLPTQDLNPLTENQKNEYAQNIKEYNQTKTEITKLIINASRLRPFDESAKNDLATIRMYAKNVNDFKFAGFIAKYDGSNPTKGQLDDRISYLDSKRKKQGNSEMDLFSINESACDLRDEYESFLTSSQKKRLDTIIKATNSEEVQPSNTLDIKISDETTPDETINHLLTMLTDNSSNYPSAGRIANEYLKSTKDLDAPQIETLQNIIHVASQYIAPKK